MDLLIRLREWGRRGGDLSATPTLPTAGLLNAFAADLIQRPGARAVEARPEGSQQFGFARERGLFALAFLQFNSNHGA